MSVSPKVSIVIPVYNGADYLDEAIRSALGQSYKNIEVIVVNDGSADDFASERIALKYGDSIRYFSKPNGGVASALNYAIREMSGDYFSWLSHDDLYCEDKVECDIEVLKSIPVPERDRTIVYSDYSVFSSDPDKAIPVGLPGVPPGQFRYWITMENSLHGCTLLIPKAAFVESGVFNEGLRTTQDYDLWFRMADKFQFVHVPRVLVKARSHSDQGSIKMAATALAECNALLAQFATDLTDSELSSATRQTPAAAYAGLAAGMWHRGFRQAGRVAAHLAWKRARRSSFRDAIAVAMALARGFAQYYVLKFARSLLRPRLRLMLRLLLRQTRGAASAVGTSFKHADLKEKFSKIYDGNIFGGRVSRSGEGSDLIQTAVIRRELPALLKALNVRTFLDAPCGDWCWMSKIELGVESYIGVDIVESLIEKNRREFGSAATDFRCLNLAEDELPKVDLIFSRDCLVHLSFEDALHIIANFKQSGSKYLLTTTFVERSSNNDLVGKDSFWRPLNMQLPPFNFPAPLQLINEKCTEERGQYPDKCLGLWLLEDIR